MRPSVRSPLTPTLALLVVLHAPGGVDARQADAPDPPGAPWTPAGSRDEITLEYRDEANGVRAVRATADLPFPAERIAALVCDFTNYPDLLPGVREARVLATDDPDRTEIYMRYAPRFLIVSARDVVVRVERYESPSSEGLGCHWQHVEDAAAPAPGTVRMDTLRGRWDVAPLTADRSRVVYEVAADPGGSLPAWLVRRGALGAPPDVIAEVRARLSVPQ